MSLQIKTLFLLNLFFKLQILRHHLHRLRHKLQHHLPHIQSLQLSTHHLLSLLHILLYHLRHLVHHLHMIIPKLFMETHMKIPFLQLMILSHYHLFTRYQRKNTRTMLYLFLGLLVHVRPLFNTEINSRA